MAKPYEVEERVPDTQDMASSLKEKASETAGRAMDKVDEAGRNVRGKIDELRAPAADKLECAASALHRKAETLPGGETVTEWLTALPIECKRPPNTFANVTCMT